MAVIEVYEFGGNTGRQTGRKMPPLAKQVLTTGSTTATSAAFNKSTVSITAISTSEWRAAVGVTPTTTHSHFYVPANVYLDAEVVSAHKIIALSATAT